MLFAESQQDSTGRAPDGNNKDQNCELNLNADIYGRLGGEEGGDDGEGGSHDAGAESCEEQESVLYVEHPNDGVVLKSEGAQHGEFTAALKQIA